MDDLEDMGRRARAAARDLAKSSAEARNRALLEMAATLRSGADGVLAANALDLEEAQSAGLSAALLDRLRLNGDRLQAMAQGVEAVVALPDPLGETFDMRRLANGLQAGKRRVPIGVLGIIYEARPNVTIDVAALCCKSGNAAILRGGSETRRSNAALAELIAGACRNAGLPADSVQLVRSPERALVGELLRLDLRRVVMQHDRRARRVQPARDRRTDALRAAGDEHHLSAERQLRHGSTAPSAGSRTTLRILADARTMPARRR
mgnify:CR=1 FL=1